MNYICCFRGESVSKESTAAKKNSQDSHGFTIGDKVDLRVCCVSPRGKVVDLVSVEFANNSGKDKYFADHRKLLREAKTNIDQFYKSPFLSRKSKKNIGGHCIQIAAI